MRILSRIWKDIRHGENIDLIIAVMVALCLGVLNLVPSAAPGLDTTKLIAPITLTVLAILASAALVNRYRLEELTQKLNKPPETVFIDEFPDTLKNDIESALELWLVGVTLSRTIKTYYSVIQRKLNQGHVVRVLLIHPEGAAVEMAETRVYGRLDVERTQRDILAVLQDLCDLRRAAPDKLAVRTIQYPIAYGAVAVDPNSTSGILYLEHYPFKTPGGSKPKFILRARNDTWYTFFKQEISTLWDKSEDWKCDEKQ